MVVSPVREGACPAVMDSLRVEAYSGYKGEETPRAFTHGGVRHTIEKVIARWYTEDSSFFRVQADDNHCYVLRYDLERLVWELVMREETTNK